MCRRFRSVKHSPPEGNRRAEIVRLVRGVTTATAIAAGGQHTSALLTDGTVDCCLAADWRTGRRPHVASGLGDQWSRTVCDRALCQVA